MKLLSFIFAFTFLIKVELFTLVLFPAHASEDWVTHQHELQTSRGAFRYEVHFRLQDLVYANRVVEIIHEYSEQVFDYFDYIPKWRVHFNIIEATTANGSAQVFPTNLIHLFNFQPGSKSHLLSMDDWLRSLVIHELIHVVHMEQTGGWVAVVEKIFGSIARWGGVVPRWFAEGIAVWGESVFLSGGRLNDPEVLFELYGRLLDPNFCSTVDCLDEPETYPHGQMAYWLGAVFLDYLEREKAGTIRCLVQQNARQIPFFLNNAFRRCVQSDVKTAFNRFRANIVSELQMKQAQFSDGLKERGLDRFFERHSLPIRDVQGRSSAGEGVSFWQSNSIVLERSKTLVYPVSKERDHYLKLVSLNQKQSGAQSQKLALDGRLYHMARPSNASQMREEFFVGLRGFDILGEERSWYRVRKKAEKFRLDQDEIEFLNGAMEVFRVDDRSFLGVYFEDNRWILKRFEMPEQKVEVLYRWPALAQLSDFSFSDDALYFKQTLSLSSDLSVANQRVQFQRLKLGSSKPELIFTSSDYAQNFRYHGSCEVETSEENYDFYFFSEREGDHLYMVRDLELNQQANNREALVHEVKGLERLADARWFGDYFIFRAINDPHALYFSNQSFDCRSLVAEMSAEVTQRKVYPKDHAINQVSQRKRIDTQKLRSHPRVSHFKPRYWILNYTRAASLDRLQVMTSLSDPLLRNNFDISLDFYSLDHVDTQLGGSFAYRYHWQQNHIAVGYNKRYLQSSFVTDRFDSEETAFSSFTRLIDLGRNKTLSPEIILARTRESDFLSRRVTQRASFGLNYRRYSLRETNFWQETRLGFRLSKIDVEDFDNHWGKRASLMQTMRLGRNYRAFFRTNYARLSTSSLESGVLKGGGHESAGDQIDFTFYGLRFGDLFGHEIWTTRLQLSANLFRPYSAGGGMIPFYLKEVDLVLGVDAAYSDFAFVPGAGDFGRGRFYTNRLLTSQHAGLRFNATLFYNVPTIMDFLYVRVMEPGTQSVVNQEWIFTLQAPLF